MKILVKTLLALFLIQALVLYSALTRTPKVILKATDHISCDEYGQSDIDHVPVDVELRMGYVNDQKFLIKVKANSWTQAGKICESWNNIGYELEK